MQALGSDTCHLLCFKNSGKKLRTCNQFQLTNACIYMGLAYQKAELVSNLLVELYLYEI